MKIYQLLFQHMNLRMPSTKWQPFCVDLDELKLDKLLYEWMIRLYTVIPTMFWFGPSESQGKHQSSASIAFARGIHRSPVDSPHKEPLTGKTLAFDDVIFVYLRDDDKLRNIELFSFVSPIKCTTMWNWDTKMVFFKSLYHTMAAVFVK